MICHESYLAEANVGHLKLVLVEDSPEAAIKQLHGTTQRALMCVGGGRGRIWASLIPRLVYFSPPSTKNRLGLSLYMY